ncbi:MAG: hypothetical protein P1U40_02350 [Coxiellaceae bacterium]|nr:hypothetical protein [Coxiellaceae bacterium]
MNPTPPKSVGVATQLIGFSILLALVINLTSYVGHKVVAAPAIQLIDITGFATLSDTVSYFIIMVLCAYFIYQRQNWARLLLVFYLCFRLSLHYLTHSTEALDVLLEVMILVYWALLIIAITLLFSPGVNAWFKGTPACAPQTTKRPKAVNTALLILILGIVVFIIINAIAYMYFRYEKANAIPIPFNSTISLIIDTPIHLIIMIPILIALSYRKNWARIILIIYVFARILFHFYSGPLVAYTPSFEFLVLLFFALNIIALTLLFCPESNRWFHVCQKPT